MVGNRVLVVGVSPSRLPRLRRLLKSAGYEVTVSLQREEGLAYLSELRHDILLGDVSASTTAGCELCRAARSDSTLSGMPVVFLTSPGGSDALLQALEAGANTVIAEDSYEETLLYTLGRIRSRLERQQSQFEVFGIEVFAGGRRYHLNPPGLQTIDLLLSTYDDALQQSLRLDVANRQVSSTMARLTTLEQSYRQLLDTNMDAIVVVDDTDTVRYANPSALGLAPELFAEGCIFHVGIELGEKSELEFSSLAGGTVVAEMRVVGTVWNGAQARLAVLRDITDHVKMREQLRHLSLHDELTGLLNRRGFISVGEQQLSLARRLGCEICLVYIDLDGMKLINDALGHGAGDQAIIDLATLAQSCLRDSDVVARIGGDEFAVFGTFTGEADPERIIYRLRTAMDAHNREAGRPYTLSASMGAVVCGPDALTTLDSLMSGADTRMYEEKLGKRTVKRLH